MGEQHIHTQPTPEESGTMLENLENSNDLDSQQEEILQVTPINLWVDYSSDNEAVQDQFENKKIQTNQGTEILWQWRNQEKDQLSNMIRKKLEDAWRTDEYLISSLLEGYKSAVIQGPKGEILEDRRTRASIAKEILKLKWYYKPQQVVNIVNAFSVPPKFY